MKIEITEADIRNGVCGNARQCPIAKAVARNTRRREVTVDDIDIYIKKDDFSFPTPKKARHFIDRFDSGLSVKPFSFVLRNYRRT